MPESSAVRFDSHALFQVEREAPASPGELLSNSLLARIAAGGGAFVKDRADGGIAGRMHGGRKQISLAFLQSHPRCPAHARFYDAAGRLVARAEQSARHLAPQLPQLAPDPAEPRPVAGHGRRPR